MSLADSLVELCRYWLLLVLVAAVVGKLAGFRVFAESLAQFLPWLRQDIRSQWSSRTIGAMVVGAEILAIGLLLSPGELPKVLGFAWTLCLFLAFTGVLIAALWARRTVTCNCFGSGGDAVTWADAARNGLLVAAAGVPAGHLLLLDGRAAAVGPTVPEIAVLAGVAINLALLTIGLPRLLRAVFTIGPGSHHV